MRPKKPPDRLVIDEASNDDNSVATLDPATTENLGLFRGDTILARGKKRKDTVPIGPRPDEGDARKIQMNKVERNNLRVKLGDLCHVSALQDIQYGKSTHSCSPDDAIEGLSGNLFDEEAAVQP